MKHAYYISQDLDEMESAHNDLVDQGVRDKHIHVYSDADAEVQEHHLRTVSDFEKTDVIRSGTYGAVIGVILASLMLALPTVLSIESPVGNMPFIFGAIVLLGFSTWEGGLLGIQRENHKFAFVNDDIHHGEHLMIVDYDENASSAVERAMQTHPTLRQVSL